MKHLPRHIRTAAAVCLMILSLFCCSCSFIDNSVALPDSFVEKTDETKEDQKEVSLGGISEPYQAIERNGKVFLYQNTAYYECDPKERAPWQPHVYAIDLDGKAEAEDLLKGELVLLCDSVLIGRTETNYCALDISGSAKEWVPLQPSATDTAYFKYQNQLILFSSREEKHYADSINLQTFESKRTEIPRQITQAVLNGDELVYVCCDEQGYFLCSADLSEQKETVLTQIEADFTPIIGDEAILLCREKYNPLLYDRRKSERSVLRDLKNEGQYGWEDENPFSWGQDGKIVFFHYSDSMQQTKVWAYDVALGKEVDGAEYLQKNLIDGGYYTKPAARKMIFHFDEQEYTLEIPFGISLKNFAANKAGAAFLDDTGILVASFAEETNKLLAHYDQRILTE